MGHIREREQHIKEEQRLKTDKKGKEKRKKEENNPAFFFGKDLLCGLRKNFAIT